MVAVQVFGNDAAIGFAGSQGNFELNVFKPVMIHNFLHSVRLIHDACHGFVDYCIAGIELNREQIDEYLNDSLMLVLESEGGTTTVEGTVYGGVSVRLIGVDGIYMETPLKGHMVFLKNKDVPGVIGRVGTILGENNINIADFSLGRRENSTVPGEPAEAVAVVRIDGPLPKAVLDQLLELTPVRFGRAVQLPE